MKSNSLKRFRNTLQSSKKLPYQRNDEINKNFRTQFFIEQLFISLYKNDIFINISYIKPAGKQLKTVKVLRFKIFLNNSYILYL
jgi:hypothetical protein